MEYRPDRLLFITTFFLLFSFLIPQAEAQSTLCDIIALDSCSGVTKQIRRSSSGSLPSPSTAANLNPANVSYDRGFGIEFIYQPNNPVNLNISTGTGKLGGALISQSFENSFFGNRVLELDDELLQRTQEKEQYKSQKLGIAIGGKLFRKKHAALDAGILLKRHNIIKKINPGVGVSGRLGPLHFGASVYQDDLYLDLVGHNDPTSGIPYTLIFGSDSHTEKFTVQTYSVGTTIKNLVLDAGVISTNYEFTNESSKIHLYSASLFIDKFLVNFAIRNEITPFTKVINGELTYQHSQNELFGGVQYSFGKHLILGMSYNFFLLHEISVNGTLFF